MAATDVYAPTSDSPELTGTALFPFPFSARASPRGARPWVPPATGSPRAPELPRPVRSGAALTS